MSVPAGYVVGGGVAGIAAAFAMRDRGWSVELLEGHHHLGGRAFTLPDREGLPHADNGPHVILGCYQRFRELLRRIGSEDGFLQPRSLGLAYSDPGGRITRLQLPRGPAPVGFGLAILRLAALGLGERLRALRGLTGVLLGARQGESFEEWLSRRGQTDRVRDVLWDPMCRAIMNCEARHADARLFVATLRRAFLGSGAHAAMWIPRRGWSELIGTPARAALEEAGVKVRTGCRVVGLERDGERVTALRLADGQRLVVGVGEAVVLAVPWHGLAKLRGDDGSVARASGLQGSPIVSVYFESAAHPTIPLDPVVALVGRDGPYHFLCRRAGAPADRFAVLSGGGAGLVGLDPGSLVAAARDQLVAHFPAAEEVLRAAPTRLAKESRATIVADPGAATRRPAPGYLPGCANLAVCGDWTDVGLPSTLEGAAESGFRVVDALLA